MANSWLRQFAVITPTSVHGYSRTSWLTKSTSALTPIADIAYAEADVRLGPTSDLRTNLNGLQVAPQRPCLTRSEGRRLAIESPGPRHGRERIRFPWF